MENIINAQLEKNIGQIIYVGAGNAPNMEWLRSLSFEQLQLIEPVESIAKKLKEKYGNEQVTVKNIAISSVTGVSDFSFMHPTKYSSLKQKINLSTVLKNSRIQEVKPINTLSLSDLIKNANLDKSKNNILMLSINGSELECLKSVTQEVLTQFSIISVQVEAKGIYNSIINKSNPENEDDNSGDNVANVKAVLKEKGFYIEDVIADGAIFTNLIVKRDDVILSKIVTLTRESKELKEINEQLQKIKNEQLTNAEKEKKQQQDLIIKVQVENVALKLAGDEQLTNTEKDKKQQQALIFQAQAEKNILKASRDEQIVKAEKEKKQQQDLITKVQAENVALKLAGDEQLTNTEKEKKQQQALISQAQAEKNTLKASRDEQIVKAEKERKQQQDLITKVQAENVALKLAGHEQLTNTDKEKKQQQDLISQAQAEKNTLKASRDEQIVKAEKEKKQQQDLITEVQVENVALKLAGDEQLTNTEKEKKQQQELITKVQAENSTLKASHDEQLAKNQWLRATNKDQLGKIEELKGKLLLAQDKLIALNEKQVAKIEQMSDSIVKRIDDSLNRNKKSINSALDKGLQNTVKQIESFQSLNNYLTTGEMALEYHGWPISSDVALFLINKIQVNNYDLIIEFGSGTSTALFAKTIKKQIGLDNKLVESGVNLLTSDNSTYIPKMANFDLPKRIVTFEHNKKYYEKTLNSLKQQDLTSLVDLVHAPLIDYTLKDESYLYYACAQKLNEIAQVFEGREAKILVLIDGPPGATGPLARLPAIPHLLNLLGNHQLDLVLDDYNRNEEKEIVERWKKDFESRFITWEEELVPCEKGAWFCRVNP